MFNNFADFSRRGDLSAMSNVETDADELTASNLSTQKPPNGSSLAKEITRNHEVLSYNTDPFSNLYLDTQLEGKVSEKVK